MPAMASAASPYTALRFCTDLRQYAIYAANCRVSNAQIYSAKKDLAVTTTISSEDKVRATAKEGLVVGAGLGGMAAGGYVASLACGPGAFFCAAAWTFAVGAAAAFGTEVAFDYAW